MKLNNCECGGMWNSYVDAGTGEQGIWCLKCNEDYPNPTEELKKEIIAELDVLYNRIGNDTSDTAKITLHDFTRRMEVYMDSIHRIMEKFGYKFDFKNAFTKKTVNDKE